MQKLCAAVLLCVSSSAFAIEGTDSFYAPSGAIVRIGDTQNEFLNKMQRPLANPTQSTFRDRRGRIHHALVYTFRLEMMIYQVFISEGRIIEIQSNYV
ncbi:MULTISPECIES: hypothetical protein [unclassified Acinetobacter]|uniref:hypothetical protein n=1 Tax=unclassified Acinetobacter TaxID=196816 RepID=UPI00103A1A93|nr:MULTISPECIES: hypothetical protein [unclassified Acinetobacter]TCB12691.1 hypothetical protein E0H78_05780 [Acinetobacter sp. ANC 4641]TCB28638.1 hypothetical protein E0H77_00395 [Acinetobacter sp. ANC 4633]